MTDTSDFIAQKQFEIIKAKSVRERFEIFDGMLSFVRQMAIKRIKRRLGNDVTEAVLKYELIKEYYGHELNEVQRQEIREGLLKYETTVLRTDDTTTE